ncbi:hypothetical protein HK096_001944, partial [Nowakowskiella sp. JEL0078]
MNQSGHHTPLPPNLSVDERLNRLMLALEQVSSQNAQILAQNNQLNAELQLLKTNQGRVPPTNIESLLKYTHNEMKSIKDGTQVCDKTYVDSWENALTWYKATSDLKQSFEKALASEYLDPAEARFMELSKSLKSGFAKVTPTVNKTPGTRPTQP